jgi:hypothetical protein
MAVIAPPLNRSWVNWPRARTAVMDCAERSLERRLVRANPRVVRQWVNLRARATTR